MSAPTRSEAEVPAIGPPQLERKARCGARSTAEYHAMLLDSLYDAVIGLDPEHRVNAWNRAAERLFGWSRDEVMGRPFEEVVPTEYANGCSTAEALERDARKGRVKSQVRRRTRSDGWIDIESTTVALPGADGEILGFVSVNRDVSVRKRAQMAMRATQRRLQSILEASNDGIWLVDARGRTEYVNARAAELLQRSVDEMLGRPFVDLVPEGFRATAQADFDSLMRGERIARREMKLPRADGSEVWVVFSPSILRNADGSLAGAVSVFMDVTAARRAQDELQQAQKLESVGRLAAGIAHEINTPIQYIGDNTYFLEAAFADIGALLNRYRAALADGTIEAAREELERAAQEIDVDDLLDQAPKTIARTIEGVRRVATIVRAMKEFAHPDRKEMAATDLNRAILATLEVARNEYKYVADVETDCGELPPVTCYPGELNQVFLNVLVNAAHAIGDVVKGTSRRGTIRVTTRREGAEVVVAISDTGPGIPEGIRDKVFDPFFTTKEVGRGTGQGLALARHIVAKHRGHLGFTTAMGQGTTFVVRLPIDPATAPEGRT